VVWAPEGHFDRHLPFALLTGFLGSGKTTLLNRILRDPRLSDTAVAINEFGDVPLDQHFVVSRSDDVVVLANGCLCCFVPGDLEQGLARIFTRSDAGEIPRFRRLIIETSGLADPEGVLQAILDAPILSRFLWLDRVVTTVDGLFGSQQIDRHVEARKQIRIADEIVVTKSDMATDEQVRRLQEKLTALNAEATRRSSLLGDVDVAGLFSPTFFDDTDSRSLVGDWIERQGVPSRSAAGRGVAEDHAQESGHREGIGSTTLLAEAPLRWRELDLWLGRLQRRHGDELLRIKGIVNVDGEDRPVVVHGVQSVAHVPVALDEWPSADRRTRIVIIFRGIDGEALQESWASFLAAP
jgi:G3E family GTPase